MFSRRTAWTIALLGFAGQLAWAVENQFFNLFLYNEIAPVPLYVSLLVGFSAIASTVTSITIGALSDKLGKRKIFFLIGLPLWALTTALFPLAGLLKPVLLAVAIAIVFDCIMTFFGAMASDAALNAYVADVTTAENRGKANAIMEVVFLIATLLTYGLAGVIIEMIGYMGFFLLVGVLVGVIGTFGAIFSVEPPLTPSPLSYWETIRSTFKLSELKQNKEIFMILFSCMLWAIAFNIYFPFVLIYLEHYLGIDLIQASLLIFVALVIAVISSMPVGKLVDRIGRKKIALFSIILESIALILFSFATDLVFIAITSSLWVFAMMSFDISSKTWVKDLFPATKRGQFSGYYILFTVLGGMTIGPFLGGIIASAYGAPIVINGQTGYVPPPILFIIAGVLMLLALIPIILTKETKKSS